MHRYIIKLPQQANILRRLYFCNKLQFTHEVRLDSRKDIQFISLGQLIEQQRRQRIRNKFERKDDDLFEYGIEPMLFRLQLFGFFKYNYWLTDPLAYKKLEHFIQQLNAEWTNCKEMLVNETNNKQAKSQQLKVMQYR